ncbi:hypothetical protein [Limosilactobacillus reuteri]|nr:hypothetical protein [Limosilactobacillus reuteri]
MDTQTIQLKNEIDQNLLTETVKTKSLIKKAILIKLYSMLNH